MGHDGVMNARSMVFDVGDWVTGWGRMVADADGEWLDLARAMTLEWSDRPRPRSHHSVRLIGADFDAVPTEFGPNNAIPGTATIGGIWLGDAIEVQSQSPAGAPHHAAPEWTTPPCPPPVGDWPHGEPDHNLDFDLGDLQTSGAAVSVVIFRPSSDQAVLVVAASNVDAVETALRPQLPDRLCVVPSRWTRAQLDEVHAHLDEHWDDWTLDIIGPHADERAQPSIHVELVRVTAALADWADALPTGLLTLWPSLSPPSST